MKTSTRGVSPLSATPCSGFSVVAVCCHLKLTKKMERELDKGMRPYDLEFEGYRKFQKALEDLGAMDVDREYYGGLNYKAETREIGETVARAAREILSQNVQEHAPPPAGASVETGGAA